MQEIDISKANWSALFEPFQFFEAYKNYLQVDIIAEDGEDLRLWKGWVESRLRQLTLKVICCLSSLLCTPSIPQKTNRFHVLGYVISMPRFVFCGAEGVLQ